MEKDFRNIIINAEAAGQRRAEIYELFAQIKTALEVNLSRYLRLTNFQMAGAWAKGTNLESDPLELVLSLTALIDLAPQNRKKCYYNEIETAMFYSFPELTSSERTDFGLVFTKGDTNIQIHFNETLLEQVDFVKDADQKFTLFKNTLIIIKVLGKELNLVIDEVLIEIILYYSLTYYLEENKYASYLKAFCQGLDDCFNGIPVGIPNANKTAAGNDKYRVFDPLTGKNKLSGFTELSLGDYRKLGRRLKKMTVPIEDKRSASGFEVIVDVNPIFDSTQQSHSWSFQIAGYGLKNQGGHYENTETAYQTAILKGIFKGLKALEANNLLKKKIILQCEYPSILDKNMLTSAENKSRMRTIQTYIRENNLNLSTRIGNVMKEQ